MVNVNLGLGYSENVLGFGGKITTTVKEIINYSRVWALLPGLPGKLWFL